MSMFEDKNQREDLKNLLDLSRELQPQAPCENYPDAYFSDETDNTFYATNEAKKMCQGCEIIQQCFEYAVKWDELGVWGGTSGRARQDFKRSVRRATSA